jgi:hypothetical protein|tara:strand:+ start:1356 stop:4142 length:2787 start_codon:yes stop_codon:yes gene_type:complete
METTKFLRRVLGGDGFYCFCAFSEQRKITKFYTSIDAVASASDSLDAQGYDIYFGLSTFETGNSRKVDNVKYVNSFFLDLDCGPSKDYPNQREALNDLRRFVKKLSLPKPVMVSSGNGVHVYWTLATPCSVDAWLPVALRLKKLCVEHALQADAAVTADAARILRIPNTHNHKSDPPTEAKLIGDMDSAPVVDFDEFSDLLGGGVPKEQKFTPNAMTAMMMDNTENVFKDIVIKNQKGTGCGQLDNIIKNQGEISEPLWRAGLSIAKFCVDADKAVHYVSKKHIGYDYNVTEEKASLIKGPYLCNTFDEYNPDMCHECPHWGKIKSPIALGRRIKEAEEEVESPAMNLPNSPLSKYVIPKYPRPYFRGANGGIYIQVRDPDGDPVDRLIYHNDLYVVRRLRDAEIGEAIVMRLHLPKDGVREFTMPLTAVTSKEELRKQLAMQGVTLSKMDELMQYITTWVNELQAQAEADEARKQFGWTSDEGGSFILGNQEIFKDKVGFNPPSAQTTGLFPAFEPKGTLEAWKDTMNFYNREGFELHQFVVGTSFGSPLMQFSPINCAALHIYSKDSGVGKTTAMAAGVTVWGSSEDLIIHERDTFNTKMNRGEVYHNLPLYMDELTNTKGRDLSNLAYQLTGGRQRGRMSASANMERHRGEAWRLLAVTTGNTSMVERISIIKAMPKAEAQRILECRVKRIHFDTKEETDKFSADIKNNYGHAGKEYVQYVMNNVEDAKTLLTKVQNRVDKEAGLTAENRYWSVLVACTITGLILAKRAGLVDYDAGKIFAWAVARLKENKRQVEDMSVSVEETLNDYIHEHWSNVLWIKSTDDLRNSDVTQLVIPEALPRGKLVARYETDLKRAYLVPKPLKEWCGKQQINYASFINDLTTKLGATRKKMRLSRGTHMNLPPTWVIIVDCSIENEDKTGNTEDT